MTPEEPVAAADHPDTVDRGATPPARRQHAVLVLPSTGAFDSRTYRIATTLLARGHEVTVVARLQPGLPAVEDHPAGYRILRVPARAIDGVPFRGLLGVVRRLVALARRRPAAAGPRAHRPGSEASAIAAARAHAGTGAAGGAAAAETGDPLGGEAPRGNPSLPRRLLGAVLRRFSIPFAIRAHTRGALAVAPAADLYHGMAYMGIGPALALGRRHRAPVVYDARDIYLEARSMARSRGIARWMYARMERGWAARAARVITVNEDYADQMERRLRVRRPLVVMNCSYRFDPPVPRERRFHERLGLDPSAVVVLYHGGLFPERGIEPLMEAILRVPDATLVLMGYGMLEPVLRARAAEPRFGGRVHLLPAVPPDQLHDWIAGADIAAMPIQPSTLNHRLTTPNKLFEAMAAGVPVLASDLPGMSRIVAETGCGLLCDGTDPASIADGLARLLADPAGREAMGARGLAAAHERYQWARQADVLLAEYGRLTGKPW